MTITREQKIEWLCDALSQGGDGLIIRAILADYWATQRTPAESQHDPAPWRIASNPYNIKTAPWRDAIGIEAELDLQVPSLICWLTRGSNQKVNGHLIAAAPALLAALETMLAYVWLEVHSPATVKQITDQARAAIAAARGTR